MMLTQLTSKDFDKVYEILEDSFPSDEIRPYPLQKSLLLKADYKLLGIYAENKKDIKAFMGIYEFDQILFIEHLAVNKAYRNQGLGSKVLQELAKHTNKTLCLEVEPPLTSIAQRRIEFYKRNGFFLNDFHYVQPPLAPHQNPVELKLMTHGHGVDQAQLNRIQHTLYTKVYNVK